MNKLIVLPSQLIQTFYGIVLFILLNSILFVGVIPNLPLNDEIKGIMAIGSLIATLFIVQGLILNHRIVMKNGEVYIYGKFLSLLKKKKSIDIKQIEKISFIMDKSSNPHKRLHLIVIEGYGEFVSFHIEMFDLSDIISLLTKISQENTAIQLDGAITELVSLKLSEI